MEEHHARGWSLCVVGKCKGMVVPAHGKALATTGIVVAVCPSGPN